MLSFCDSHTAILSHHYLLQYVFQLPLNKSIHVDNHLQLRINYSDSMQIYSKTFVNVSQIISNLVYQYIQNTVYFNSGQNQTNIKINQHEFMRSSQIIIYNKVPECTSYRDKRTSKKFLQKINEKEREKEVIKRSSAIFGQKVKNSKKVLVSVQCQITSGFFTHL